jgi:hypothetical protein
VIRVLRRSPIVSGIVGLVVLAAFYEVAVKAAARLVGEIWYRQVECRLVDDHASLVPPRGNRLWGMYRPEIPWNYQRYYTIADSLDIVPSLLSWYQAWGDGPDHEFKTDAVEKSTKAGLVSMVTWEPWLSAFHHGAVLDPESCMVHVARGEFDPYIRSWARAVVRSREPVLVRPMHELGNPWYGWSSPHGNSPRIQIEAWRHIVALFREEGARNAAFVWTPYDALDTLAWPGREWVDWIGLDIFNYGTMVPGGEWVDFKTLLDHQLEPVKQFGKPVILAEVGTTGFGGDRTDWWRDAFLALGNGSYPEVRAVVIFDNPACINSTGIPVDWGFSRAQGVLKTLRPLLGQAGFRRPGPGAESFSPI